MTLKDTAARLWRNLSITAKFRFAFTILLAVLAIETVVSLVALQTLRNAEVQMQSSREIRQRIFEMDGELEKARRLHLAFFIQYPEIGFAKAHSLYFEPSQAVIARVVALSEELKERIASGNTSQGLRERDTDINIYLSSARRFSKIFQELIGLMTTLALPEQGVTSQMSTQRETLGAALRGNTPLLLLFQEMVLHEQAYRVTHQRPHMQMALNHAFQLNKALDSSGLPPQQQAKARHSIDAYTKLAERTLDIEVDVRSRFRDLALQAKAVDPISADLKALASTEVERARARIDAASKLSTVAVIFMAITGLVFAAATGMLIHASVTRRITTLTAAADELRAGNLDTRADATGKDELAVLASTFNDMAARMRDMVGTLETKVRDRTSELADARDKLQAMVQELGEKNMALEVLSRTDRLTGIANRRKLEEALHTEVLRARRYNKPFSVIMLDVDHFKDVNDLFGHHTGDVVLNTLAAKLATKARETDVVGRWGGEEFLIVCPETETAVSAALAERLRHEFSESTMAEAGRVTCSFGVAGFQVGDDAQTLIARADTALYRAKDNGRNRVEVEEKAA